MLNALVNEQLIESRVMVCLVTVLSPRGPSVCTPVHIHAMELEQALEGHGEQVCTRGRLSWGVSATLSQHLFGPEVSRCAQGSPGPSTRGSSSSQPFPPPANHCEEGRELVRVHSNLPSELGEASVPWRSREMGLGYADRYKASPSVYLMEKRKVIEG